MWHRYKMENYAIIYHQYFTTKVPDKFNWFLLQDWRKTITGGNIIVQFLLSVRVFFFCLSMDWRKLIFFLVILSSNYYVIFVFFSFLGKPISGSKDPWAAVVKTWSNTIVGMLLVMVILWLKWSHISHLSGFCNFRLTLTGEWNDQTWYSEFCK